MPSRNGPVHVATIVRRYKGRVYKPISSDAPTAKATKSSTKPSATSRTLPAATVELVRRSLKGETFVSADEAFRTLRTLPHGHVEAVLKMIRKLGLESVLGAKPSRQRDLVVAMLVQRILFPCSKLATTRDWHNTTLAAELNVADANEEDLYAALDWLLTRQRAIEGKLAARHLGEGGLVLYDVSSSYYEGRTCPLARYGHNRDGKKGRPIIVYGVLTDAQGRPVAVEVYPGNTGDPTTVPDQVDKLRERFGLSRVVLAGDRGMLTQTQIEHLKEHPGLGWISCLRSGAIRQLIDDGRLPRSLFDERNLAEISSPEFPGERLIACYNPLLADQRRQRREELLAATERDLKRLAAEVARRTKKPLGKADDRLEGRQDHRPPQDGQALRVDDRGRGVSIPPRRGVDRAGTATGRHLRGPHGRARQTDFRPTDAVRNYKRLANVEQAFRSLKSVDLRVRPIYHRIEHAGAGTRVVVCVGLLRAVAPEAGVGTVVVRGGGPAGDSPLSRSGGCRRAFGRRWRRRRPSHRNSHGRPVHSFATLLHELATRCRTTYRIVSDPSGGTFDQLTEMTPFQAEAFRLIDL